MRAHIYHPIYRQCTRCGMTITREQASEECLAIERSAIDYEPEHPEELKQIKDVVGVSDGDFGVNMGIDAVLQHFEEKVRLECRALIQQNAQSTWKVGLIERSDGITEVLVDFDQKWPRRD